MNPNSPIAALIPEIEAELAKATTKFPTWPTDPVHAAGVVGEEYGELQQAILEHTYEPHKSTKEDVRKEAIQVAAMAIRFLRSMDTYEFKPCAQHAQSWPAE